MKLKNLVLTALCAAAAAILLPACASMDAYGGAGVSVGSGPVVHSPGPVVHSGGPPDHAPAHGYRKKHRRHDVVMVYDSGLGVYVIAGHDGLYFHGDYFYRMDGGGSWRVSLNLNGPWEPSGGHTVPAGLYKHGKSKSKSYSQGRANNGPGKGKGKGPGKGKGKGKGRGSV